MNFLQRYFVARWLRSMSPGGGPLSSWLRSAAYGLPGREQSVLGAKLFEAAEVIDG